MDEIAFRFHLYVTKRKGFLTFFFVYEKWVEPFKILHIHTKLYVFCDGVTYNITFVLQKRNIGKKSRIMV